jgi:hypothetical protein
LKQHPPNPWDDLPIKGKVDTDEDIREVSEDAPVSDDVLKSMGLPALKPRGKLNLVQLGPNDRLVPFKDDEAFAKVLVDKRGMIIDPNFKETKQKVSQVFQENKYGMVVPFDKRMPLHTPTFALLPMKSNLDIML